MYNNVNKKIKRIVNGRSYSWYQLVAAVRKDMVAKGLTPASPAVSNAVLAMTIKASQELKVKNVNTDAILLEYARRVLKNSPAEAEQVLLTVEDNPVSV